LDLIPIRETGFMTFTNLCNGRLSKRKGGRLWDFREVPVRRYSVLAAINIRGTFAGVKIGG